MTRPDSREAGELYLDLLKRSLTNSLFAVEPDANRQTPRFMNHFIKHYINSPAVSMLPLSRFDNLQNCVVDILENGR